MKTTVTLLALALAITSLPILMGCSGQPIVIRISGEDDYRQSSVEYYAEETAEATPPTPSARDGSSAERIVHYFCTAWKDEDWERMYWAMNNKYRKNVSLKKFTQLFEEDAELNGGLADETIQGEAENVGANVQLNLVLKFNNKNVRPRNVKVLVNQTTEGFRILESGIIPVDFSDL